MARIAFHTNFYKEALQSLKKLPGFHNNCYSEGKVQHNLTKSLFFLYIEKSNAELVENFKRSSFIDRCCKVVARCPTKSTYGLGTIGMDVARNSGRFPQGIIALGSIFFTC